MLKVFEKIKNEDNLTKSDVIELLKIKNFTAEYYELLSLSNTKSQMNFHGKGYLFAQIGINAKPCD